MVRLSAILPKDHPLKVKRINSKYVEHPHTAADIAKERIMIDTPGASKLRVLKSEEMLSLREAAGLTQMGLSKKLGFPQNEWHFVEKGKRPLTVDEANRANLWLKIPDGCTLPVDPNKVRRVLKARKQKVKTPEPAPAVAESPEDRQELTPMSGLSASKQTVLRHIHHLIRNPKITDAQCREIQNLFNHLVVTVVLG